MLGLILMGATNNIDEKIKVGDRVITISIPSDVDVERHIYRKEQIRLFFSDRGELRGTISEIQPQEYSFR